MLIVSLIGEQYLLCNSLFEARQVQEDNKQLSKI